jgi:acylphosphatase
MPDASANDLVRIHAVIHGRVQGVNFRSTTSQQANMLGIHGWVRNCGDGTVETIAEGPRSQLTRFLDCLREGPRSASVEQVEVTWEDFGDEFDRFYISP